MLCKNTKQMIKESIDFDVFEMIACFFFYTELEKALLCSFKN